MHEPLETLRAYIDADIQAAIAACNSKGILCAAERLRAGIQSGCVRNRSPLATSQEEPVLVDWVSSKGQGEKLFILPPELITLVPKAFSS